MGKIKASTPMLVYIAQLAMTGVITLTCVTLVTLGRLIEPVILAIFLVSLIASFLVSAKLLAESSEQSVSIGILIAATIVGLGIGWFSAIPVVGSYSLTKMQSENVKNLELIRDSITLYKLKTGGYPPFLVGGAAVGDPDNALDPMIREGVLKSYPVNPFGIPDNVVTWPLGLASRLTHPDKRPCYVGADFLRNLQEEVEDPLVVSKGQMSRFGLGTNAKDVLTGSILADPNFKPSKFGYPAWGGSAGIGKKKLPWIPGMFFYKTWRNKDDDKVHFIVGIYGSFFEKGYDLFGKSPEGTIFASDDSGNGCPFRVSDNDMITVGNPDGQPDGIVCVFTDEGEWTPEGIKPVEAVKLEQPDTESGDSGQSSGKTGSKSGNEKQPVGDSPWIK